MEKVNGLMENKRLSYNGLFIINKMPIYSHIAENGFVKAKEKFCYNTVNGEGYYVYLWKHIRGDAFYVGSGINKRWVSLSGRNARFYTELDRGDVAVYKVVNGLTEQEARMYEKYLSVGLSRYSKLSNSDYPQNGEEWIDDNIEKMSEDILTGISNTIWKINADYDFSYEDRITQEMFLKKYGNKYFSSKHSYAEEK